MMVYSRKELIQKKVIGFLKYEIEPYLFWINKISEYFRNKPVVDLNKNDLFFHSGLRVSERFGEAILFLNLNPIFSISLLLEGFGNYIPILNYDQYCDRKKSI